MTNRMSAGMPDRLPVKATKSGVSAALQGDLASPQSPEAPPAGLADQGAPAAPPAGTAAHDASAVPAADMTKEARAFQRLDAWQLKRQADASGARQVRAIAPAKVNLHLAIGATRSDGRHEVSTVLHALTLHDVVAVEVQPAPATSGLSIEVEMVGRAGVSADGVASEHNIASRAVEELARRCGRSEDELVRVRIEKNVPMQAGLGGGSSNAAATLVALSRLWGLALGAYADEERAFEPSPEMLATAQALGSDVPFFLYGGCARFEGAGERFMCALAPAQSAVVLVKPASGVSTPEAYQAFDRCPIAVPAEVERRVRAARTADEVGLFNNLAPAAETLLPELSIVREWLKSQPGVRQALLCGSGSTTLALCDDSSTAIAVASAARLRGWWARTSALSSARAALLP